MKGCKHRPGLPQIYDEACRMAIPFHGHLGPYLVFGLKMGFLAREELKLESHFHVYVEAGSGRKTPFSCMADGLQISCGATLGKGNIRLAEIPEGSSVYAKVEGKEKALHIKLTKAALEFCRDINSWQEAEQAGEELGHWTFEKLFHWEECEKFWGV